MSNLFYLGALVYSPALHQIPAACSTHQYSVFRTKNGISVQLSVIPS